MSVLHRVVQRQEKPTGKNMASFVKKALKYIRKNTRELSYYGGVLVVLVAIACAAEGYRSGKVDEPALVLPAVELEMPVQSKALVTIPEDMKVLNAYSAAPKWNRQLGCWQSHTAVDFESEDGRIVSFSEGTVVTVGESGVLGGFIEIETGEYIFRYASVDAKMDISPGDTVQIGEEIGKMDTCMPSEAHMGAHLHLEVFRGEEVQDVQVLQSNTAN